MMFTRQPVVQVHSSGRLGNQLFLAAIAEAARAKFGAKVVWHGSPDGPAAVQRIFPLGLDAIREHGWVSRLLDANSRPMAERGLLSRGLYSLWWRSQTIGRQELPDRDGGIDTLSGSKDILIRDYHQRFENFGRLRSTLGADLLSRVGSALPQSIQKRMQADAPIAVHMRFGDFLELGATRTWGQLAPDWVATAVRRIRSEDPFVDSPLWIFSDDPDAASAALAQLGIEANVRVRDFDLDDVQELALLAACPAKVISNSTFSWWAGYLSSEQAVVVAPLPLMRSGERESAADPRWVRIPAHWS